jgi:hypothetical protein
VNTVWKWPLMLAPEQTVTVPAGARPLHLADQHGIPCLWLLVDPDAPRETWTVRMVGTGWQPQDFAGWTHLGSVLDRGGTFVWHYFREEEG